MESNRRCALEVIRLHAFNASKPSRLISGIAVSSPRLNANGSAFEARGAQYEFPIPLLWHHDWSRPLGEVKSVTVRGDTLFFTAQIGNKLTWTDQIWAAIISKQAYGVSIGAMRIDRSLHQPVSSRWDLLEISIAQSHADDGAVITSCSERAPVVYSDGRSSVTLHWEDR